MKRIKDQVVSGINKSYLVSFGDTMTALLAFFIVLNSLAEDQTGANLHSGTGSFAVAISGYGVTNRQSSKRTSFVVQGQATSVEMTMLDLASKAPRWPIGKSDRVEAIRLLAARTDWDLAAEIAAKYRKKTSLDSLNWLRREGNRSVDLEL